jgi:hypothetical protein
MSARERELGELPFPNLSLLDRKIGQGLFFEKPGTEGGGHCFCSFPSLTCSLARHPLKPRHAGPGKTGVNPLPDVHTAGVLCIAIAWVRRGNGWGQHPIHPTQPESRIIYESTH